MDVLGDEAAADITHEPRHGHVLAELGDLRRDEFVDRAVRVLQPRLAGAVAGTLDFAEHVLHQLLEVVGAGHEVRFAVDLDQRARRMIGGHAVADNPFFGGAAGLLARAGEAALPQDRGRLVEIAVRLAQRVLALHHARAGLVAELLHHVGRDCDRCHCALS